MRRETIGRNKNDRWANDHWATEEDPKTTYKDYWAKDQRRTKRIIRRHNTDCWAKNYWATEKDY